MRQSEKERECERKSEGDRAGVSVSESDCVTENEQVRVGRLRLSEREWARMSEPSGKERVRTGERE